MSGGGGTKEAAPLRPGGQARDLSAGRATTPGRGPARDADGHADPDAAPPSPSDPAAIQPVGPIDSAELDLLPPARRQAVRNYFRRPPTTGPAR